MLNKKMPVVFAGHGSPLNAILDNRFSQGWTEMGAVLPKPKAILAISAHWYTHGNLINDSDAPKQIFDMYGFPEELYQVKYPVPGSPELAARVAELIGADVSNDWGVDHGTWSVLHRVFPDADVPIVQLSVNHNLTAMEIFDLGQKIRPLRNEGIMIFASGDIVHNLGMVDWDLEGCYDWAAAFDTHVQELVKSKKYDEVIAFDKLGPDWKKAIPTPEHYLPLIYALGATDEADDVKVVNEGGELGSITMTSFIFE